MTGIVFQKNWEVLKEDICKAVEDFIETTMVPNNLNETHMCPVPKRDYLEEVGNPV